MRIFLHEVRGQLLLYRRSKELAFFTFLLPLILFVLLGSNYGNDKINGVRGADFLEAGMLGYGARLDGVRRARDLPRHPARVRDPQARPRDAAARVGVPRRGPHGDADRVRRELRLHDRDRPAALLGRAADALALARPRRSRLGAAAFAALGLGMTAAVRSAEGASATVNAVYLPMAFISGAFFSPHRFPPFLRAIADVLPLTYFIRLTRDVMLHGHQIWDNGADVAVIVLWGAIGAADRALAFPLGACRGLGPGAYGLQH